MIDLDLVTDGWWEWDLKNPSYEYLSPKFWHTLGVDPATMPHSPDSWRKLIHEGDRKRAIAAIKPHMNDGAPYHLLVRYRHADGHLVWIVCRGAVEYDSAGEPERFVGVHQDVTDIVQGRIRTHPDLLETSRAMRESVERMLGLLDV